MRFYLITMRKKVLNLEFIVVKQYETLSGNKKDVLGFNFRQYKKNTDPPLFMIIYFVLLT